MFWVLGQAPSPERSGWDKDSGLIQGRIKYLNFDYVLINSLASNEATEKRSFSKFGCPRERYYQIYHPICSS